MRAQGGLAGGEMRHGVGPHDISSRSGRGAEWDFLLLLSVNREVLIAEGSCAPDLVHGDDDNRQVGRLVGVIGDNQRTGDPHSTDMGRSLPLD